ncbi:hypothetical protein ACRAJ3_25090 [Rhodococcus pyridinivorans]|uniref:hypothetical protein n=1 Tax=Rhodococcus pyridinivorans TaxID=103816 RepID=UPI003D7FF191
MSIRDELAALLRQHAMPSLEADYPRDEYECCADAILARHAVVELPEPVREYQEQGPAAEWTVRGNGYALVRNDLTIVVSFKGAASPAEARQMAAALVAAANRAEAADVDR